MKVDGNLRWGCPKKTWWDCMKEDMPQKGMSADITYDGPEWKIRTRCADPTLWATRSSLSELFYTAS